MLKSFKLPAVGELGIAVLVIAIVWLMILPLPTEAIDLLLAVNITISVTLLMVTMYVGSIVSLSAFPSLLLFTTLYRLSLNIASTKSILLHADAGHIIESFGQLVVGGNLVVGMVVFVIITTVQFIVIAKGSERVAEVGARFTLDALPGKQMSIDADLRANLLTPDEARKKRSHLAIESQLHGGMDGAMKFVKGDAIAGLIITLINIVAGIAVGVAYHGMTAGEAANRFSILSVGDAMVSQIPSLLISVAAGVMITRVADDGGNDSRSLGAEISHQLSGNSRALFFAALLLLGFAAVPGFPAPLFILLSGLLAFVGYRLQRAPSRKKDASASAAVSSLQRAGAKGEAPGILPRAPQFACPIGVRLAPDLAAKLSAELLDEAFDAERIKLQEALGLPFPGTTMWIQRDLPSRTFEVLISDVPCSRIELPIGKVLLPDAGRTPELAAKCQAHAAVCGFEPSYWIDERAVPSGSKGWRAEQVIARETIRLLRSKAHLFVGIQEAQWMLDQLNMEYPGIVAEAQKVAPVQRVAEVLKRLLEEGISIRNVRTIVEALIVWAPKEKDTLMLTEYVRGELSRFIAYHATGGERELRAVLFDASVEQHIRQSLKQTPTGNFLAMPPDDIEYLTEQIQSIVGATPQEKVALVTSMDVRRYARRMIEARLGWLPVYSYQELGEHVDLQPLGRVTF